MASFGASKYARAGSGDAIVISGFAQLQAAFGRIADGTQQELQGKIKEVGGRVALVAAGFAPRGATGELQHSPKVSAVTRGASVYSTAVYGGAINFGAWMKNARGPHISRGRASHYMDRAVTSTAPWVAQEMDSILDWVTTKFEED